MDKDMDLLEFAWGVIANVSGSNWDKQSPEWQDAAKRWRDQYHARLDEHVAQNATPAA